MQEPAQRLEFRGGPAASLTPFAVFALGTLALVIAGAPAVEGMIVGAVAGLSAGLLLSRDYGTYTEAIFTTMANRVGAVAVACWLWAGAFSGLLANSGLVEALVWLGSRAQVSGAAFTMLTFLSAALFATAVGTGLGTTVGFTAVMYPAGLVLGADPGAIMGAILSGSAFGDNVAPISDTTIVSAATQETDVRGVVRSRLKYVGIAGALSLVLFLSFGGGAAITPGEAQAILDATADPRGLPMLIPAVLVVAVALRGRSFLAALAAGIVAALAVGEVTGVMPLTVALRIEGGTVEGALVDGLVAMFPISILTLLLVASLGLMEMSGFLGDLLTWLQGAFARTVRGAEGVIVSLISVTNLFLSVNTVAMVAVGPLANRIRKEFGLHPYRSANLMDTVSCSFPYMLPYSAPIVAAAAVQREVATLYPFAPVVSWGDEVGYIFYGMVLFPLMLLSVWTGFGRRRG